MNIKMKCEQINVLCHGCLTEDRTVHHISEDISEMFYGLRSDTNNENCELTLCWECVAFLKKLKMFQARIKTAQCLLIKYIKGYGKNDPLLKLKSLSSLNKICINTFDYEFDEDEKPVFKDQDMYNEYDGPDEYDKEELVDIPAEELQTDIKVENNDSIKEEYISSNDNDSEFEDSDKFEEYKDKSFRIREYKKHRPSWQSGKINYQMFATVTVRKDIWKRTYMQFAESTVLDRTEYEKILKRDKNHYEYLKMKFKCDECKVGYLKKLDLQWHKSHCHSDEFTFPYKCADCPTMVTSLEQQDQHWTDAHSRLYKCTICAEVHQSAFEIKKHIEMRHRRSYTCNECGFDCGTLVEFRRHYQVTHERVICDYCNKEFKKKRTLISHIQFWHIPAYCGICKRTYAHNRSFKFHNLASHPEQFAGGETRKELSYCVECDKQYSSEYKYNLHLRVHEDRKVRVPCPECGKIISKKYLNTHYKFAHLKVTKHYCDQCNKYYSKKAALQEHIKRFHEKIPLPKDKMCDLCGRGFATNKILQNHRRTHTGERPYKCQYCPAAFAQMSAMKTHEKTQHKNKLQDAQMELIP